MPITVTLREGMAAVGGLIALAGLWILLSPVTATVDGPAGVPRRVACGSALVAHDVSQSGRVACEDPLSRHHWWGWPVLLGGGAVAASALMFDTAPIDSRRHARGDNRR